ncbi:MAG: AbfB domain-containing protein [Sedimentisphaerales bacterium]|nr:AbfB domain-containing protein [Sedimentisphaerales bacterium]
MWIKNTILITLLLCLAGFSQAQPVMPTGSFYLEAYDMPGWYMTCVPTGNRRIILVQGKTPEALWLVDAPFAGNAATTISLTPEVLPGYYARHAGWIMYTDPSAGADQYYNNDASWHPRAGLANPGDSTLVSFENNQYAGNYIQHNAPGATPIEFGTGSGLTVPAGQEGRATFRIVLPDTSRASNPKPADKTNEISIDVGEISWTPGEFILTNGGTHNVFFGTDEASVTNATIAEPLGTSLYEGLDVNNVILDRLEYGTTYYWRVDEVNIPSKPGTSKGLIWNFTTELEGYPLEPVQIINVTASDNPVYPEEQEPNMTCNESGLDVNDMHSTELATMWLGMADEPGQVWIQYEFDKIYKLHDMLVWNYNETPPGETYGAKDVNIVYSLDGVTWTALGDTVVFNEAAGYDTYSANTTVDFSGKAAKYVKLTFWSSFEDGLYTGGLSEVRFSAIPTRATEPDPEDEDTGIAVDALLGWKAGRGAAEHNLYIGTDVNAVTEGTASMAVLQDVSYAPVLELARTYYWKVDEVNMAEEYTTWDGPVWSFSTVQSIVVDNFEVGYDDSDANAVWVTWKDGFGNESVNGALMGYEFPGPYLSTTNYNGGHSAPIRYNNTTASYSEVKAQSEELPIGTVDWTIGSPTTLVLWIYGDLGNNAATDRLYVKIGSAKILFTGDISKPRWMQMNIPLSTAGINQSNISSITIGLEKIGSAGGTGTVLIDNIRLYREAPALPTEEIWIQAEDAVSITTPFEVFTELEGAMGGQYIGKTNNTGNNTTSSPAPDATATYTFTVNGGVYRIDCRIITISNSDGFWIQIPEITDANNIKVSTGGNAVLTGGWIDGNNMRPRGTTWHWAYLCSNDNNNEPPVEFILPAGTYTLKLANRDDGTMLDAFVVTKVRDL